MKSMFAAMALLSATVAGAQSPAVYVQAGALLDVPGQRPRGAATVVVRDGKVEAVRDGHVAGGPADRTIDLRDRFVMPGMIDAHVHLYSNGDPLAQRLAAASEDYEDRVLGAARNAKADLDAGFTTVRDLGGEARGVRALRDAIDRGDLPGPRILFAGRMISVSGGHGDVNGVNRDLTEIGHDHATSICNGADDCRRAVRDQIAVGATVIKFAATGGVLSNVAGGLGQQMTDAEMRAIVETAHGFGRKVAAHAHAKAGIEAALNAGVDSIEHGSYADAETARLFKAKGAWLVPTMIAPVAAVAQARAGQLPPASIPKAEAASVAMQAADRLLVAQGVKIAFGTDTGVSKHGLNATEFALMVEAGMTPAQAIVAATTGAAELLGRPELGRIVAGAPADLIAVTGSPLEDVRRLERVAFVMKAGRVEKADDARP